MTPRVSTPLRLNVESGEVYKAAISAKPSGPGVFGWSLDGNYRAAVRDSRGKILHVDFQFPRNPSLVGERYAFGIDASHFLSKDLLSPEKNLKRHALNCSPMMLEFVGPRSGYLIIHQTAMNPAAPLPPNPKPTLLFSMEEGVPTRLSSWPASHSASVVNNELLVVDPANQVLSRSSLDDLKKSETFELREFISELDPSCRIALHRNILAVTHPSTKTENERHELYRIPSFSPLATTSPNLLPVSRLSDGSYTVLVDTASQRLSKLVVVSLENESQSWTLDLSTQPSEVYRHGSSLIVVGRKLGCTVQVFDIESGKLKSRWQPFASVAWAAPMMLGLFPVLTLSLFALKPWPAWASVAITCLLFLTALLGYLWRWDIIPGPPIIPLFNYCHGLFLGLGVAAFAWLTLGNTRISLRYLPAIGVFSLQLLICRFVFSDNFRTAAEAFTTTFIPCLIASVPLVVIRLLGFRCCRVETSSSTSSSNTRVPIRDLFIAAAGAALLSACLRPFFSRLELPEVGLQFVVGSTLLVIGVLAALTAQIKQRLIFALGALVATAIYLSLGVDALYEFITGKMPYPASLDYQAVVLRVVATSLVTLWVVLLSFRFDGWRIARTHPSNDRTEAISV